MSISFIRARWKNIERLAAALAPYRPYLRDAEPNLAFAWDAKTISGGLNFTLTIDLGDVDLFGEVAGSEIYSDVLPDSFDVEAFGVQFKCMDLPTLIRVKEAAGRPKDREALAELRVLLEEQKRMRR